MQTAPFLQGSVLHVRLLISMSNNQITIRRNSSNQNRVTCEVANIYEQQPNNNKEKLFQSESCYRKTFIVLLSVCLRFLLMRQLGGKRKSLTDNGVQFGPPCLSADKKHTYILTYYSYVQKCIHITYMHAYIHACIHTCVHTNIRTYIH